MITNAYSSSCQLAFKQCLLCAHQVQDMAVLVMDEAHHANGNHPYATIMAHFVSNTPKHMRPRVLGLTATPVQVGPCCSVSSNKKLFQESSQMSGSLFHQVGQQSLFVYLTLSETVDSTLAALSTGQLLLKAKFN